MQWINLLFYNVFSYVICILNAEEYSNRWTMQIDGDKHEADRLAEKHGFVNLGKVSLVLVVISRKILRFL